MLKSSEGLLIWYKPIASNRILLIQYIKICQNTGSLVGSYLYKIRNISDCKETDKST